MTWSNHKQTVFASRRDTNFHDCSWSTGIILSVNIVFGVVIKHGLLENPQVWMILPTQNLHLVREMSIAMFDSQRVFIPTNQWTSHIFMVYSTHLWYGKFGVDPAKNQHSSLGSVRFVWIQRAQVREVALSETPAGSEHSIAGRCGVIEVVNI